MLSELDVGPSNTTGAEAIMEELSVENMKVVRDEGWRTWKGQIGSFRAYNWTPPKAKHE